MNPETAIRIEGLWKRYGLPIAPALRRRVRAWRRRANDSSGTPDCAIDAGPWALRDISLTLRHGDSLGIIGRNGAGKSTLLKVLAGVTPPTRGTMYIGGRVFPMIELNAGLHPELTGRENVRLLAAIMGLSRSETAGKIPEIERFTELGAWFDRPVRTYSTGMLARLGFGVAVNVDSDVLLVDEVLAVGDLRFQNKCLARIKDIHKRGRTVLFVSHNLDQLQYLTGRAILIESGRVIADGDPLSVLNAYERKVFAEQASEAAEQGFKRRKTTGDISFESVQVTDSEGVPVHEIARGEPFGLALTLTCRRRIERPSFQFSILNARGIQCIWRFSDEDGLQLACLPEGRHHIRVWLENANLVNGYYEFAFAIRDGVSYETLERFHNLASFAVTGEGRARGIVDCRCKWEHVPR